MSMLPKDDSTFQLTNYDYILPEELIAQEPSPNRESSRLLVFNKKTKELKDSFFSEIINELPKNALIIANNSRVVPARILGQRETGSSVEMLLMTPVSLLDQNAKEKTANNNQENQKEIEKTAVAQVLLKGSKRIKVGEVLSFQSLTVKILEKQDFGKHTIELTWKNNLVSELEKHGSLPLPPYIKRPDGPSSYDANRYQTVYAKETQSGSVAAPTAGLHFTKEIQKKLIEQGFLWEEITLHVGYGTFSPVRADDIREHDMHAEYVEIPERTAQAIIKAKAENRPIITIGTTATRSLEGMAQAYRQLKENGYCDNFAITVSNKKHGSCENDETQNTLLPASGCSGYTNIFIYPGKKFHVIDGLLTNFHLPKSSLLMLVSAFAGYESTMNTYEHAILNKYRFFSYGDAMLIRSN